MDVNEMDSTDRTETILRERKAREEYARLLRHHRRLTRFSALCLLLTASTFGMREWQKRHSDPMISDAPVAKPVPEADPSLTRARFDALRVGMTEKEVIALLGERFGTEMATPDGTLESASLLYFWGNSDTPSIHVEFKFNTSRLVRKWQSGLK